MTKLDLQNTKINKTIRVLIAHYQPDIVSGAEHSISDFVDARDQRFQIIMLTPGKGKLSDYYKQRGFSVWTKRIETRRRLYPGLHTFQSIIFARKLREREINVVLCNTFYAALRVNTACRMAGIPHGIYIREYFQNNSVFQPFLDQADNIFAVSRDVMGYLGTMTPPKKIVIAYNHINAHLILEKINTHKARRVRAVPFSEKHPVIGMIGRITRYKQQDLFVRAIPHVLSDIPNARFVIVGNAVEQEKDYEEYIKKLAVELGIQNEVVFMGHRADALEIISELSVSCLPSTREPLGRVLLESQIIGCPVVASDTGGSPEIIQDGVTGLLFPPTKNSSEKIFATQIIRVLTNLELRKSLVANAKTSVKNKFTGLGNVRKLEQNLENLAKKDVKFSAS